MIIKITAMMIVMLMLNTCVFAQYYMDDATGISLIMSDDWEYTSNSIAEGFGVGYINYTYRANSNELVLIAFDNTAKEYGAASSELNTDSFSDDQLFSMYDLMSDETIAKTFVDDNINIKSESLLTSRETIGNTNFYRIEKAYTGTQIGYQPYYGYATQYIGIKNGNVVIVYYDRPSVSNHFSDVYAMLQSIVFPTVENPVLTTPTGISIVMNGEYIYPDSAPIMQNDRVLVPIRAVAEKMGYTVEWDDDGVMQAVNMRNRLGTNEVMMIINNPYYFCNDDMKRMDVAPAVIGDYTYIPLRAAAEAFGANVSWDDPTQTVYISY